MADIEGGADADVDSGLDRHAELFEPQRRALLSAAYRVLGTIQDSEDVVQETWLRWRAVDLASVREPRAYLVAAATRTALNTARTRSRRREEYIGPWLPEPVSTGPGADPGDAAAVADEISLALLVVLESLTPLERAAFMLRTVFGVPYPEIAETLGRTEPAVRQLVRRAGAHVREQAPRRQVDRAQHEALTRAFRDAVQGSVALTDMMEHLAPDVVLTTDAGGLTNAALRPIQGAEKVLRFTAGVLTKPDTAIVEWTVAEVNGAPALIGFDGDRVDGVIWFEIDDGLVTRIDMVRNPEKLQRIRLGH